MSGMRSYMSNFDLLLATRRERELIEKQKKAEEEARESESQVPRSNDGQERPTQPTA